MNADWIEKQKNNERELQALKEAVLSMQIGEYFDITLGNKTYVIECKAIFENQ